MAIWTDTKKINSTIEILDPKNLDFVAKMKFLGQLLAKLAHGPPIYVQARPPFWKALGAY